MTPVRDAFREGEPPGEPRMRDDPRTARQEPRPPSATAVGAAAAVVLSVLARGSAGAEEVQLLIESPMAWPGDEVALQVRILDADSPIGRPELPAVAGLVIRGPAGPSRQTSVVNGRRKDSVIYGYSVQAGGGETGTFTIGPASIPRRGLPPLESNRVDLHVAKRPPPGIRFTSNVEPPEGPIAAPFRLRYTVSYTGEPYDDSSDDPFESMFRRSGSAPFGLVDLDLPLLKLSGLRLKPIRLFGERPVTSVNYGNLQLQIQEGFEVDGDGSGYRTVVFGFEAVPFTTGAITIPGARVRMRLQGKVTTTRDIFGRLNRVREPEDYEARSADVTYAVRPLPAEGRPEGFTGAVGNYRIQVTASPLEVDAFAPITLEVRVTGKGVIEELKPPAWSEVSSLTRDFDVAGDVDSGKVEGKTKVIRQVIRARSEKVTAIPPIPFPYFDPAAGRYEVARSEAIPIKVRPVKTVGSGEAIPSARREESPGTSKAVPHAILDQAGIGANFRDMGAAGASLDPREEVLSAPFLAAMAAPPLFLAAVFLLVRSARKDPRTRLRERAHARAEAILRSAGAGAGSDDVSRAFQGYFRERFGLSAGEITPPDLEAALGRRGVPADLRAEASRILERLLAGRFGGPADDPRELAGRAQEVIREVERAAP